MSVRNQPSAFRVRRKRKEKQNPNADSKSVDKSKTVRRSSQILVKNEQHVGSKKTYAAPKMLKSLNIMMQRTANENANGFGNQCACQNVKCSDNHQNMRIMLAVLRFKNGRNFASFLKLCENLCYHNL